MKKFIYERGKKMRNPKKKIVLALTPIRAMFLMLAVGVMTGSSFGLTETFDSGIPASWSIVDNFPIPGGTGIPAYSAVPWTTNVPESMGNYTDGTGQTATASSYSHPGQYDVSLITPAFAISPGDDMLRYRINYQHIDGFEAFDTDISIKGAAWMNMVHQTSSLGAFWSAGPPHVSVGIDMGFFGAMPGDLVQVRFRYYSTYLLSMVHNEYVQIDDVTAAGLLPEPATLLLLGLGGLLLRRKK
jgi:hypothetical protein